MNHNKGDLVEYTGMKHWTNLVDRGDLGVVTRCASDNVRKIYWFRLQKVCQKNICHLRKVSK